MRAQTTSDVDAYVRLVVPFLQREPVERNVLLTLLDSLRHGTLARGTRPVLAWVQDDAGTVVGAAVCTLPYPVLLASRMPDVAVDALADALAELIRQLPGVNGPTRQSKAFAERWRRSTGAVPRPGMAQRAYRLDVVTQLSPAPGALRPTCDGDHDLLTRWVQEFHEQVGIPAKPRPGEWVAHEHIAGRLFVWESNGRPVSMANTAPQVCGVVRIRTVYTPVCLRGNGYARSLVASVSQQTLDSGADCCTLNTDLANPTSNSIYSQIGYRPVLDMLEIRFDGQH